MAGWGLLSTGLPRPLSEHSNKRLCCFRECLSAATEPYCPGVVQEVPP